MVQNPFNIKSPFSTITSYWVQKGLPTESQPNNTSILLKYTSEAELTGQNTAFSLLLVSISRRVPTPEAHAKRAQVRNLSAQSFLPWKKLL